MPVLSNKQAYMKELVDFIVLRDKQLCGRPKTFWEEQQDILIWMALADAVRN